MQNDNSKSKNIYPKISVVIPSYNKGKYIKETLQSIVDQNYPSLEVIVQDGGSTDGSFNIIKSYSEKYEYIKWELRKDRGQVDAINKGLKKASGDILTYINADDVYEKSALKSVAEAYEKHPKAMWFAGKGKVINASGKGIAKLVTMYKNILLKFNSYNLLLIVNYLMQPSVFFSRTAYKKHGQFAGKKGVVYEYEMWLEIGREQMPQIVDTSLSKFRLYKSGFSSMKANTILRDDYNIAKRYTSNLAILLIHKIHNWGRLIIN